MAAAVTVSLILRVFVRVIVTALFCPGSSSRRSSATNSPDKESVYKSFTFVTFILCSNVSVRFFLATILRDGHAYDSYCGHFALANYNGTG